MRVITDFTELMQALGAYAYSPDTPSELAQKLQTVPGSAADKIFTSFEMIYAWRDQLGPEGLTLLGQIAGYAKSQSWEIPGNPGRFEAVLDGVKRDLGEPGDHPPAADDPEPIVTYRPDDVNWKTDTVPELDELGIQKRKALNDLKVVVASYTNAVHARCRALKDLIEEAQTVEQLEAIDVTADWPEKGKGS